MCCKRLDFVISNCQAQSQLQLNWTELALFSLYTVWAEQPAVWVAQPAVCVVQMVVWVAQPGVGVCTITCESLFWLSPTAWLTQFVHLSLATACPSFNWAWNNSAPVCFLFNLIKFNSVSSQFAFLSSRSYLVKTKLVIINLTSETRCQCPHISMDNMEIDFDHFNNIFTNVKSKETI